MAIKKRATAPNVKVRGTYRDTRAEMLKDLEAENKGFTYCYMPPDIDAKTLSRSGLELVKDEDGKPLRWREDVIARQPAEDWQEVRDAQTEASADVVKNLYCRPADDGTNDKSDIWKKNSAGKRVAKRKDPSEIDNYGGM